MEFKYNYVICGADGYYKVGYHDIITLPNVCYHESFLSGLNNFLSKSVVRWNFSRTVNRIVRTPFAFAAYRLMYPHCFDNSKPLCYIFFGHLKHIINSSYLSYLRKEYPEVKLVLYMQDLISTFPEIDIEKCKKQFDLVLSYDMGDCNKYGLQYHPTPMSFIEINAYPNFAKSDVYFCGRAKGRYQIICEVYERCKSLGLKCDFHVMSCPKEEKRITGIHYDSYYMSYTENLQRMSQSKCIVEVMQPNADGFTPRLWESIVYGKHLLTNNKKILSSNYYNPHNIKHIEDFLTEEKDSLVSWLSSPVSITDEDKMKLSPINLLTHIDYNLSHENSIPYSIPTE